MRPALVLSALALAVLGAVGFGPALGGDRGLLLVVDASPSCDPPADLPASALLTTSSDLGRELARAAAREGVERILLYTDGVDTGGGRPEVPAMPVDVILRPRSDHVGLLSLQAPERVVPGQDFSVSVQVGRSAVPGTGAVDAGVTLLRDGRRVGAVERRLAIAPGQRRTVRFRDRVPAEGLAQYRAVLRCGLGHPADAELAGVLHVGDRPLLLAVGDAPGIPGFHSVQVPPGELVPFLARPGVAEAVDVVLLAGPLPDADAQRSLADCIRGGAGLVVLGGQGFGGRPLEQVLPLTDTPPDGRAVLLVLDYSGSMEPLLEALLRGVARLGQALAPTDRIAFLAFRGEVVASAPWAGVAEARWDLRLPARGNTRLGPALLEARRRLSEVSGAQRRMFVVSDGEWADAENPDVAETLRSIEGAGVHAAAVYVCEGEHPALFANAYAATDDLEPALVRLEERAPDRTVAGPVQARRGTTPAWLEAGAPPEGSYRDLVRLYPRGVEADLVLRAGDVPLLATREVGGRVLVVAPDPATNPALAEALPALLGACCRPGSDLRLDARREGSALLIEGWGEGPSAVVVGGQAYPMRPAGPGRWRACIEPAPAGALALRWGERLQVLPPAEAGEFEGLTARPDVAAWIAGRSGGRLLEEGGDLPRRPAPAAHLTLLVAAGCILAGALAGRRG